MIVILGAGLSGLQLGRRLHEQGRDFLILEKGAVVGGLCRTLSQGEYSWDVGPHGFYSKDSAVMDRYYKPLPIEYHSLKRDVRVCHKGLDGLIHDVNYPFENGISDLPLRERLQCVAGYCWASWTRSSNDFENLRQWINTGLGYGIAKHFMIPYNEKIWNAPLDRISMDLVKQKIEPEKPWRIIAHAFRSGSVGRAYQASFIYPKQRGAGAIPEAVAAPIRDRIRLSASIRRLRRTEPGWKIETDSQSLEADTVVSTIPLPELLVALGDEQLREHSSTFAFNDTHFVVIGLKRGRDFGRFKTCQWVFFAGPETFYRVNLMHNFAPSRPPTLVAEITRKGSASGEDSSKLIEPVIGDLLEAGILGSRDDLGFQTAWLERYTYPIQTVGLSSARDAVESRLKKQGLYLLGRMGRWEYINTDGVFRRVDEFLTENGSRLR